MSLEIVTIVLNGMPYIERHLEVFQQLQIPWRWHVVEGAAQNVFCTRWCKSIAAGLSTDGTTEYLASVSNHQVLHYPRSLWRGKIEMVNAPLSKIDASCVLMQVDSDEMWTAEQLTMIHNLLVSDSGYTEMEFLCRYFVGPDIITGGGKSYYGNRIGEWRRAWRYEPGMIFLAHEPPNIPRLAKQPHITMPRLATSTLGLVFEHFAYTTEAQVRFKEKFYGYKDAYVHWCRLQDNEYWPVKLKHFFPWVQDETIALRI